MNRRPHLPRRLALAASLVSALWLAGCGTTGSVGPGPAPQAAAAAAANGRAYRGIAARHIYDRNSARIYKGQLPPMLYAVGTLQVNLDASGKVLSTHWLRAPRHAPEVVAEIERLVRQASPFPPPGRLGAVTWTDTWLWDKSGRFQLDTLTEGQQQGD